MKCNVLNVQPFDPETASPAQKLAVGRLLAEARAFAAPEDPPEVPEKIAQELGFLLPDELAERFCVWAGEQAVGWASINMDSKRNLHAGFVRLTVHPDWRRQGMARALAGRLEAVARREGRHTLTFSAA